MEINIAAMKGFVKKHISLFVLLAILSGSLLLKLLVVYNFNTPLGGSGDAYNYDLIAKNLAMGKGFVLDDGLPTAERAPAYCFFLAGIYFLFGHSLFAAKLAQVFLSELTLVLIYLIALQAADRKTALLAAFFTAFYPKFILWTEYILSETFGSFLIAIFIYFLLKGIKQNKTAYFFISGVFLGINALNKIFTIYYLAIIFLIFFFGSKNKAKGLFIFFIIAMTAISIVAPWTYRNYKVFKRFVPVNIYSGSNIYIASLGLGRFNYREGLTEPDQAQYENFTQIIDADRLLLHKGLKNIALRPFNFSIGGFLNLPSLFNVPLAAGVRREARKEGLIWKLSHGSETPFMLYKSIAILADSLILILGVIGLFLIKDKQTKLIISSFVVFGALIISFFSTGGFRFFIPFLHIWMIPVAAGLTLIWQKFKQRAK